MYTAKKRIVVNGRLAAYEGEVMEDEEAVRRGIVPEAKKPTRRKAKATAKGKKAAEAEEPETVTEEPEEAAEAEEE